MASRRKLIRKAIAKILTNTTQAGAKVFTNQSTPVPEEDLPCIKIYPRSEAATKFAEAPRELKRIIDVSVEIFVAGPEEPNETDKPTVEDLLDDLADEVECELSRDDTVRSTADDIILINTEFEFDGSGARPIGSCRMTYAVTYHQLTPDSIDKQTGIEDFKRSHTDYHVGHHDEKPDLENTEAEDDIVLPQT